MPPLLLLEALLERGHDLVPRPELLDIGHLGLGQMKLGDLAQPFLRDFGGAGVDDRFDPLEHLAKHLVEAVEQTFVLHVATAAKIIELLNPKIDYVGSQRLEQRQMLLEARRDFRGAEFGEEVEEHLSPARRPAAT